MIVSTTETVPGRRVRRVLGIAKGTTVRSRHIGKNLLASFRAIVGGEITDLTKVVAEAREQALDRMIEDARRLGADAVLAMRFASAEVMRGAAEIVAYGTAVALEEETQA